jgi:GNAT superfamily N-acetyltransferase
VAKVESLSRKHEREAFHCGVKALNDFLQRTARQHQERGVSRTFALVDPNSETPTNILGFFTLSACEAFAADLPAALANRLPRVIPAVLLGRLAIDRTVQGQGYGSALLVEAIRRVAATSTQVGVAGLFVDAKDDNAAAFYRKYGFVPLPANPRRLFLPLSTLLDIVERQ